jgi:hypothetical protein
MIGKKPRNATEKSVEKKDATEKLVKKQENIPIKIVHQITWKRK